MWPHDERSSHRISVLIVKKIEMLRRRDPLQLLLLWSDQYFVNHITERCKLYTADVISEKQGH